MDTRPPKRLPSSSPRADSQYLKPLCQALIILFSKPQFVPPSQLRTSTKQVVSGVIDAKKIIESRYLGCIVLRH